MIFIEEKAVQLALLIGCIYVFQLFFFFFENIFILHKLKLHIVYFYHLLFFFFDIFVDYAITVVPFPPLHSTPSCTPPPSHIPPLYFMSMGHTYKFFGFYISYTILTLPLSIFHLSFMLFILCTFPLSLPLPIPY